MLVVGEKDMAARVVSPRTRGRGKDQQQAAVALDEFAVRLREEAKMPAFASSGGARRHYNDGFRPKYRSLS